MSWLGLNPLLPSTEMPPAGGLAAGLTDGCTHGLAWFGFVPARLEIPFVPVLAFDLGTLLGLLFLVMAFLSWLLRLSNGKNRPPPQQGRGRRPVARGDAKVNDEIEVFLREMGGRREGQQAQQGQQTQQRQQAKQVQRGQQARPQQRQRAAGQARVPQQPRQGREVVARGDMPQRAPARRQGPASGPAGVRTLTAGREEGASEPQIQPAARSRPGDELAHRKLAGSDEFGARIRSQLAEQIAAGRLEKEVAERLQHAIDRSVTEHFGATVASESEAHAETRPVSPETVAHLLRDPQGVRQAVLLSEILAPPRSLQR